jgi:hypothetical protein
MAWNSAFRLGLVALSIGAAVGVPLAPWASAQSYAAAGVTGESGLRTTDSVITAPFQRRPKPAAVNVGAASQIDRVDLYTIIDRSPSMAGELSSLKTDLASVGNALKCPPAGTGDPADCIADLWAGAGAVGNADDTSDAFRNFLDLQPNPNYAVLPTALFGAVTVIQPLTFAMHAAITGDGGANFGLSGVPSRTSCVGSPAAGAGFATFGYPCFRAGALPVVVLATNEPPLSSSSTVQNPSWSSVVRDEMLARGARFVGLIGANSATGTQDDLNQMASDTGSVDANNGNAPLVFPGPDAGAATALGDGLRTLTHGLPLDVHATVVDDPSDAVDAVAAFVDHVEVQPRTTKSCAGGLVTVDADDDGFAETYMNALPGTSLCWRLVLKANQTVAPTSTEQVFRATISIDADGISGIDQRELSFVVPAAR